MAIKKPPQGRRRLGVLKGKLLLERTRSQASNFDVYALDDSVPELSGDGFGSLITGPSVAKFYVIRIVDMEKQGDLDVEIRQVVGRVAVPTSALIEFCSKVLKSLGSRAEMLANSRNSETRKLLQYIGASTEPVKVSAAKQSVPQTADSERKQAEKKDE